MNFNTVDVFMAIMMAAIICIGSRNGIISEAISLLGIFCAIFITLHYYVYFADYLRFQVLNKDADTELFAFSLLAILVFMSFFLINKGWVLILRIKLNATVDRWGGTVLSLIRSYFTCSLIFLVLLLVQHEYATARARQSVSRYIFRNAAVGFYKASYFGVIQKFFPSEELNEEVFKLIEEKSGNK